MRERAAAQAAAGPSAAWPVGSALSRGWLYGLVAGLLVLAYGSLAHLHLLGRGSGVVGFCPLHRATGLPCPACGTSRSVLLLFEGDVAGAALANPLGLLAAGLLVVLPVWLAADLIRRSGSFQRSFARGEALLLRHRWLLGLGAALLLANWVWNIQKGI